MLRELWDQVRWWGDIVPRHLIARITRRPALPPGSLGPGAVLRFTNDRFLINRWHALGPVFKVLWSRKLTVCVVGLERGRRLLAAHSALLQPRALELESFVPKGFLRRMRGPDHHRYRAGFLDAFRLDLPESDIRAILRAELSELARLHAAGPPTPEQLNAALDRAAIRALLIICFGARQDSPAFDVLERHFSELKAWVYPRSATQYAAYSALRAAVLSIAGNLPSAASGGNADTVLGRLTRGSLGPKLDDTAAGNLIYMIDTGRYDMRGLFRWVMKYLSDYPTVVADLRAARPEPGATTSLAEACVLETLRLDQAEALGRDVLDDFVFEGHLIPKGSALRISLRESHRDARTFPSPDEYRPCRFATQKFGPDAYAPFGIGEHRCLAGHVVISLSTWLVDELVSGFEWSVVGDGPRHHGRYHWEPSPSFAVGLRSRKPL